MGKTHEAPLILEHAFLKSALSEYQVVSDKDFYEWLGGRAKANQFEVNKIGLGNLKGWCFDQSTGNLGHESGKFFSIEGIEVQTNFGHTNHWTQPIINQPEIGILGFLTKKINGVLHFLVQAKMEPGNVNILQLSPTVQATKSNYTQVHGGKKVPYLKYFLDRSNVRVHVDRLLSEQGARFFRKRNRNMIIEVDEHENIKEHEDFCWLTLKQLFGLLKQNNMVNMDSRTVLSCVRFTEKDSNFCSSLFPIKKEQDFYEAVCVSSVADEKMAIYDFDSILSWFTEMKTRYELHSRLIPLKQVKDWEFDGAKISHKEGGFFSVIGVSVIASNREVQGWQQPLIESLDGGILCFICQRQNDIMHFLVQARVEPGILDCVELAPSLQCTPLNYSAENEDKRPPFFDLVTKAPPSQIRYKAMQSEEGGRFYHDQHCNMVVEIDPDLKLELPENYMWMTISQIKEFIRFNHSVNIEARGLLSCLGLV